MPHSPAGTPPPPLATLLVRPIKRAITAQVVALFNDRSRGEKPVKRRPDGLFGPNAIAWRVHGDVTSMMVGGIAGLLLQMLHLLSWRGFGIIRIFAPICMAGCGAPRGSSP